MFSSQGCRIKAIPLTKLLTRWELLVLTRPSQTPQERGWCRWLHSATTSAVMVIKKTDMDPIQIRHLKKKTKPSETNRRLPWACFNYHRTKRKQNKARPGRSRVAEAVVLFRFCWRHNPRKQELLSDSLSWAADVEDSPGERFWGRCAGRFQHKTMFISIISRLFSSKLLLAHSDSRWATSLW